MNLLESAKDMLDGAALWVDADLPFKATVHDGHPRVMVVVGENCSGKSFFVECLRQWVRVDNEAATNICVSIRERVGRGPEGAMQRLFMFGDESEHSTGATSVGVIDRAFGNMPSRHESGKPCVLVLDEPELGLSEGYARAMGSWLARKAKELPESAIGVVIVTHSKAMVEALGLELGEQPSLANLGSGLNLQEWLTTRENKTVDELLALSDTDHTGWRAVRDALEGVRKNKEEREAKPRGKRSRT